MKYAHLIKAIDSASQQMQRRAVTAVNQALVIRNWLVGAYIVEFEQQGEDRAKYGEGLYARLAADLGRKGVIGCGERMLQQMGNFYRVYPQLGAVIPQTLLAELPAPSFRPLALSPADCPVPSLRRGAPSQSTPPIPQTVFAEFSMPTRQPAVSGGISRTLPSSSGGLKLLAPEVVLRFSWSKLLEFIRLDNPLKRAFYENECLKGNWSVRQLQRQIGSLLYERTALSKNKEAVIRRGHRQERQETIEDLIRDPYVLEFTGLEERPEYLESDLEMALLDHLQAFLLELGTGFCFEARQKRITVGNKHDYIDLVFYQRKLRCHVLLDLKIRAFQHGDAGQMNFYLNWWKAHGMEAGDNPPVGIILCSNRDRVDVEFATAGIDNRLFVSRYLTALPSEEQLRVFLERDRDRMEATLPPPVPKTTVKKKAPSRRSPKN